MSGPLVLVGGPILYEDRPELYYKLTAPIVASMPHRDKLTLNPDQASTCFAQGQFRYRDHGKPAKKHGKSGPAWGDEMHRLRVPYGTSAR
jgi:hypothetical protein